MHRSAPGRAQRREAIDRAQASALDAFLRGVELRALRHADFATRDREEALELVQDAMLSFVRSYATRPPAEWAPLFWRVLQNRVLDWHRRGRVREAHVAPSTSADGAIDRIAAAPDEHSPDPLAALGDAEALAVLERGLEDLPERQRQVFLLRVWEGLDVAETAHALGLSPGSVKTHLFRALGRLRALLEEHR